MNIRHIIRNRMAERGVTHEQLSQMTGTTRPRITTYLSGGRDAYGKTISQILDALDLEIRPKQNTKGR